MYYSSPMSNTLLTMSNVSALMLVIEIYSYNVLMSPSPMSNVLLITMSSVSIHCTHHVLLITNGINVSITMSNVSIRYVLIMYYSSPRSSVLPITMSNRLHTICTHHVLLITNHLVSPLQCLKFSILMS